MTKIECTHCDKSHTTTQYISFACGASHPSVTPKTLRRFVADQTILFAETDGVGSRSSPPRNGGEGFPANGLRGSVSKVKSRDGLVLVS